MFYVYNKDRFVKNVTEVRRRKQLPISYFEDQIEVKRGYFSRLSRSKNTSPSVKLISDIYRLNPNETMSLDSLLLADPMAPLTKQDLSMLQFLRRLIDQTRRGKLHWKPDAKEALNEAYGLDRRPHILEAPYNVDGHVEYAYRPIVGEIGKARAIDIALHAFIAPNVEVYLTYISFDIGLREAYELHMVISDKLKSVCSTQKLSSELSVMLRMAYQVAKLSLTDTHIDPEAIKYLDTYIKKPF